MCLLFNERLFQYLPKFQIASFGGKKMFNFIYLHLLPISKNKCGLSSDVPVTPQIARRFISIQPLRQKKLATAAPGHHKLNMQETLDEHQ